MKTNYVVACWSGMRRVNPKRYMEDRTVFLRRHLESLQTLKHSLAQVTVVVAQDPEEPASYRSFLADLPKTVGGAPVVLVRRPNVGYSYGGYSDVYGRYRLAFDRYLLMEDDYVFLLDHFDRELGMMLEADRSLPTSGFLTFELRGGTREWLLGRARRETPRGDKVSREVGRFAPDTFRFPQVAVGLMKAAALESVWTEFGRLPYSDGIHHAECKFEGQFSLSVAVQKGGWGITDVLPRYRVVAFGPQGETLHYGPPEKPLFLAAVQTLL